MKRQILIILSFLLFAATAFAVPPTPPCKTVTGLTDASNVAITGGTITGITDLAVADGGTGASTLTDHGVLVGSGTSAVTPLAVGTTGQVLLGVTGADPIFGSLDGIPIGATTPAAGAFTALKVTSISAPTTADATLSGAPVIITILDSATNTPYYFKAYPTKP
jgi:hypothetical protein